MPRYNDQSTFPNIEKSKIVGARADLDDIFQSLIYGHVLVFKVHKDPNVNYAVPAGHFKTVLESQADIIRTYNLRDIDLGWERNHE